MKENVYQASLIKKLKKNFNGCIVLKNDPNYIQGIPDLIILYKDKWAALECKRKNTASKRPNQLYFVEQMNRMSFAAFISPENETEVLHDMEKVFGT